MIKRKQSEDMHRKRLKLEEMVSKISSGFLETDEIDQAIDESLRDLGLACTADRAYLSRYRDDGAAYDATNEWCARGVKAQKGILQNMTTERFNWWRSRIQKGKIVHISDVESLPQEAAAEREALTKLGVKSLLALPVYIVNKVVGFIGVDRLKNTGGWTEDDFILLHLAAELIGKAIERQSYEQQITEQKDLLWRTIDSLPHPFYVLDAKDFTVTLANSATHVGELPQGVTCYQLTHGTDRPCNTAEHLCPVHRVKATKEAAVTTHFHHDKNGVPRIVEVHASPIFDRDGNVSHVLEYTLDITERKQPEERLQEETARAIKADRLKSSFLANMSHEIRTPLNSIIGFIDIVLSGSGTTEKNREYLQDAKESGRLLLSLINDILDLSKIEAGQLDVQEIPCSLSLLLNAMGANAQVLLAGKEDRVSLRMSSWSPELSSEILSDPYRLEQILNNLISNAVKFTDRGFVEFGANLPNNETLEFYVRDTGIGIPEEMQDNIFNAFQQSDSSISRRYGGTGLGLAISKKLVELLGGEISVRSKPGEGSVFYFCIPYKPVKQGAKKKEMKPEQAFMKTKTDALVLVAEDNARNQALILAVLEKNGYSVLIAEDGKDAVSRFKTNSGIELILMDIQMPHLDGLQATRVIRDLEKKGGKQRTPIIALTAAAMKEDKQKCLDAGCDDYLSKPLDINLLLATLGKFIPSGSG